MANVVDSTNYEQYVTTGKVDAYKPPEVTQDEPKSVPETPESEEAKEDAPKGEKSEEQDDANLTEHARKVIGKKHRVMKEAEEFAEREYTQRRAAEKRADDLAKQLAEMQEKSRPAPVEVTEPKQEDFATVQEYIKAMVTFNLKIERDAEKTKAEQARIEAHALKTQNEFAASLESTRAKYSDFDEVTEAAEIDLPTHLTQYLLESDAKAELGYKLSVMYRDDRAELNRILNLSPIRAIAELGKLEASLEKKPVREAEKVPAKLVSKAPAPITPIEGKSAPVNPDLNRDMTYTEYKKLKSQQAGKR